MALCCFYAYCVSSFRKKTEVSFGFGLIGIACLSGVLRYGFSRYWFEGLHDFMAHNAGTIGVPMIGFGLARSMSTLYPKMLNDIDPGFAFIIAMGWILYIIGFFIRDPTFIIMISFAYLLHSEGLFHNYLAITAIMVFVYAGLVVGDEDHEEFYGFRQVNVFHYLSGVSMILFAHSLQRYDNYFHDDD